MDNSLNKKMVRNTFYVLIALECRFNFVARLSLIARRGENLQFRRVARFYIFARGDARRQTAQRRFVLRSVRRVGHFDARVAGGLV